MPKTIAEETAEKILKSYISYSPDKIWENDMDFVSRHIQTAIDKAIIRERERIMKDLKRKVF